VDVSDEWTILKNMDLMNTIQPLLKKGCSGSSQCQSPSGALSFSSQYWDDYRHYGAWNGACTGGWDWDSGRCGVFEQTQCSVAVIGVFPSGTERDALIAVVSSTLAELYKDSTYPDKAGISCWWEFFGGCKVQGLDTEGLSWYKNKEGNIIWYESQGSLYAIPKVVAATRLHTNPKDPTNPLVQSYLKVEIQCPEVKKGSGCGDIFGKVNKGVGTAKGVMSTPGVKESIALLGEVSEGLSVVSTVLGVVDFVCSFL